MSHERRPYRDAANRPLGYGTEIKIDDGTKSEYDQKLGIVRYGGPQVSKVYITSLDTEILVKNAHLRSLAYMERQSVKEAERITREAAV